MATHPATRDRVARHSPDAANRHIRQRTEARLRHLAAHPGRIPRRLRELDREWDIERTLEATAATLAFGGTMLGALRDRRFLALPAAATAFLLQHALLGWCPPLPLFRSLGVRTAREIEAERAALLLLRDEIQAAAQPPAATPA